MCFLLSFLLCLSYSFKNLVITCGETPCMQVPMQTSSTRRGWSDGGSSGGPAAWVGLSCDVYFLVALRPSWFCDVNVPAPRKLGHSGPALHRAHHGLCAPAPL